MHKHKWKTLGEFRCLTCSKIISEKVQCRDPKCKYTKHIRTKCKCRTVYI